MKKLYYYGSTASFVNDHSTNFGGTDEYANNPFTDGLYEYQDTFSFGCWIKPAASGVLPGMMTYINQGAGNGGWGLLYVLGSVRFYLQNGGSFQFIQSNAALTLNTWTHVGASLSAGKVQKMFINGVQQTATLAYAAITYAVAGNDLDFGIYTAFFLEGRIAAPAIFNGIELSAAQWTEVMNAKMTDLRLTSVGANLVYAGYYPTGQAGFPTMADYIGGVNETLFNMEAADIDADVPV